MGRHPFQTPPPSRNRRERVPASISIVDDAIEQLLQEEHQEQVAKSQVAIAATKARDSWQKEVWATKTAMLNSGLMRDDAYMQLAKVLGKYVSNLEQLSVVELRIVREWFENEYGEGE